MSEYNYTLLALLVFFLPLLGFLVTILLGKKFSKIYLFEVAIITIVLILSIVIGFFKLGFQVDERIISQFTWIDLKSAGTPYTSFIIELGIVLDNISVIMLFVVSLVSTLVHYFSIAYMKGDPRFNRYFAYLGLFTFSMMGIVLTHNFLMMYIFWELVGVSSYLLIGFWYEKDSASDAAKKAFLANRVGDLGMLAGLLILFTTYHTFTIDNVFGQIALGVLPFNSEFWLTIMGVLLFCGAIGKSAQLPLHVWLPDAMEGPTPVSALIHAATMVAAGVYLVTRIFPLFTGDALLFIAVVGALSALIPATIALTQNDIKKVLAYSTISQLGYMIMALGIGSYFYGYFHLITHAFFKAGLFLAAGSVIHAMHHEQDIQNMGGLRKKLPITYATFLVFCLAISGVPLTSGFLSKDGILAGALAFGSLTGHYLITVVGFTVAMLTAFYMFRLLILTFHGKPKDKHAYDHAHESPALMTVPLIILAVLSFFAFYSFNPTTAEKGWVFEKWIQTPESVVPESARYSFMVPESEIRDRKIIHSETYTKTVHDAHIPAVILSLLLSGFGILVAFTIYYWKKISADKIANSLKPLYKFSLNKWYFDELYDKTFIAFTMFLSKILNWFDAKIIDGVVNGAASVTRGFSKISGGFDTIVIDGFVNFSAFFSGLVGIVLRKMQTGKVQVYIVLLIFSIVILIFYFSR
ncbi:MAG: NADH-quinone oxidoreductase subunit L [Chlorobiaceae bacterium]|nr:NADH-quinone oxidoreductase subunit L [Chlorobiaceae bacterium]MBA4310721.1 NADH-quinone oxidoreductase subunit L [Chlorobiaceae bacterium]